MAHGLLYNPSNWYWNVAKSATQVYSSASAAYVPISNPAYVAWLSKGNAPTKIAVEADLWGVLAAQHPTGLPAANATAQAAVKTKQANDIPPRSIKGFYGSRKPYSCNAKTSANGINSRHIPDLR